MKQINIRRGSNGNVAFDTVSITPTENVFFTNLDPDAAHWPDIASNQVGAAPSANSSQCTVPSTPGAFTYKCKLHTGEQGTINVFSALAAQNTTLAAAKVGIAIPKQQVVSGGKASYSITGDVFQVVDGNQNVIASGAGPGPGLDLLAGTSDEGITVLGTPTVVGTYQFTFTVNDAMGQNLQQVQYSMVVSTT